MKLCPVSNTGRALKGELMGYKGLWGYKMKFNGPIKTCIDAAGASESLKVTEISDNFGSGFLDTELMQEMR